MRPSTSLPASRVPRSTLLVLVATWLAAPLAAQEIGDDDFRISYQGGTGELFPRAFDADAAYDPNLDRFLVVWSGGGGPDRPDQAHEIWIRQLDGIGQALGPAQRISDMGTPSSSLYGAWEPAVVYNPVAQEYLVVWSGNCLCPGIALNEFEIYGQRLDANANQIGTNDFRISETGGTGVTTYSAREPALAHDPVNDRYLVVWRAFDDLGMPDEGEDEIFGQLLASSGATLLEDFRISDQGVTGFHDSLVERPSVAFAPGVEEYLVVWSAEDAGGSLASGELEIFGQRIDADALEVGTNDFQISEHGGIGDSQYDAREPSLVWNPAQHEYLVVWTGDEVPGEDEVFARRLGAGGSPVAPAVQLSHRPGFASFEARVPTVALDPITSRYTVLWQGDSAESGANQDEIFGQFVSFSGQPVGPDDFRVSRLGPDGDHRYDAVRPRAAVRSGHGELLVVFDGDDDQGGLIEGELEIFGQRLTTALPLFVDGFESGDLTSWTSATP